VTEIGRLGRAELEAMAAAGREVLECHRVLAKTGGNIVGELLPHEGTFYEYDHCPPGDIYDRETHAQYYYHAHRDGEHGHFHTFLREKGMPEGVRPVAQSLTKTMEEREDKLSHIVAISMDRMGVPIALFTTNRWVTGETWYAAADIIAMLDRFEIDHARPSWPTNRWIGAMLRLFRPQIAALLRERDAAVAAWREEHPDEDAFEDRRLEITSQRDISVDGQIAAVEAALARRGEKAG
jgi:hypothetical protein